MAAKITHPFHRGERSSKERLRSYTAGSVILKIITLYLLVRQCFQLSHWILKPKRANAFL